MHYQLLLLVPSLLSLLSQQQVIAASAPSPNFWPQAQQVVQDQIYLISRIERALIGTDLNRVVVIREQLNLYQRNVERFLKSQYPVPTFLCGQGSTNGSLAPDANLNGQQVKVYCALLASSQQLTSLGLALENRMPKLADLTMRNPITASTTAQRQNLQSLGVSTPSKYLPLPNLPLAEPPLIGVQAKTPISDYVPPMQPAIALPEQAVQTLQVAKQLLAPAIAAFPPSTTFIDPEADAQAIDTLSHAIYYKEPPLFAQFLAQPHTGIVRILPAQTYRTDPTQIENRLKPTVAERFPFAPLLPTQDGFTPRLALRIENGNFDIAQLGLDYGFIADLGEVPIEDLRVNTGSDGGKLSPEDVLNLSPQTQQFFLNYRPPTHLNAIQTDRQRFIVGKLGEIVSTQAPAELNHTYLLRLVQYKLPQVILTGGSVPRRERHHINQILQPPSSDLLVAVRPVIRREDGSYTVLWRLLSEFPNPQITDLEKYIHLD